MVLLDKNYALVTYDEENQLGIVEWKAKCTPEEYQSAFMALLEKQKSKPITRYISDIRKQSVISPMDRKWFEKEALPQAVKQGLKAAAVVFDGNAFKKYYINVILNTTNKYKLPMQVFNHMDEAKDWLMKTV
ncbi:MAG: STAS/SEC14 domain-containing protein [Salinivirgaceae bacterium]|nr:STAS/SEC14 domain-containing protein [Salinivirgaceae bacterium]